MLDFSPWNPHTGYMNETEALEFLRSRLVDPVAVAHFRRIDGRIVTLEAVRVDSIGPSAENPGVIGVEYTDDADRITHLPFIESWEIEYK